MNENNEFEDKLIDAFISYFEHLNGPNDFGVIALKKANRSKIRIRPSGGIRSDNVEIDQLYYGKMPKYNGLDVDCAIELSFHLPPED